MEHLFELQKSRKLLLLSKEELSEYLQIYTNYVGILKRQLQEAQKENDRLRGELGYGQTIEMPFLKNLSQFESA